MDCYLGSAILSWVSTRGGCRLMERGGQNELRHYIVWFSKVRPKKGHAIAAHLTIYAFIMYLFVDFFVNNFIMTTRNGAACPSYNSLKSEVSITLRCHLYSTRYIAFRIKNCSKAPLQSMHSKRKK